MRFLHLTVFCVGLSLLLGGSVGRTAGQEKKPQGSQADDLNVLWGSGKTVWEFEKKDAENRSVRLTFTKPRGGKPMFGSVANGTSKGPSERFEYAVDERDEKRYLTMGFTNAKDVARGISVNYELEGDTLRFLEVKVQGQATTLDWKGTWKRVPAK